MTDTLEAKSLWYKYKTQVWSAECEQTYAVHNIVRTFRALHGMKEFAYLSVPITSGIELYACLERAYDINDPLREFLTRPASSHDKRDASPEYDDIMASTIDYNYRKGYEFLKELQKRTDSPILHPADLVPRGHKWEQAHFQALWLTLIAENSTSLHMSPQWEFSTGAVEEFTHVYQLRLGLPEGEPGGSPFYNTQQSYQDARERMRSIDVLDPEGNPLSIEAGIEQITSAISWVENNRFNTDRLTSAVELLEWTQQRIAEGFYQ
ncbi:MAG: hypothetical protein QGG83_02935 [Candidatus Woesearchaeota archaeon]|nr:hypothetical protein [Candidatus Woesearchaeota archaeon]MDP7181394.1 hypothetical protein [Candidatus Woesearchaeota archaeon]MDP7466822.1 hypothetical protein [Candidatus Woesearchaeota archaeon]MDP7648047.1 hypothetical protein [Candidatus Woesearchaeota archaeon]